jgi:Tfp pilus assembly protein PilV
MRPCDSSNLIGTGVESLESLASGADRSLVRVRARKEDGFGLIELLIAMTVLNIGILAIVAAFNSGAVSLGRASMIANATTLADKKMEIYRGLRNCAIYLTSPVSTASSYTGDSAYSGSQVLSNASSISSPLTLPSSCPATPPSGGTGIPDPRVSHEQVKGADGRLYWMDAYVVVVTPTGGEPVKQVTVVVRDPGDSTNARSIVRVSSTFDYYAAPDSP